MVKRSRYIFVFFHLARRVWVCVRVYTFIRRVVAIFSRVTGPTVDDRGKGERGEARYTRLRYCYAATRKAADIISTYDGSCAMLTFHF